MRKNLSLVRDAIPVRILEDHQAVFKLVARLPFWIGVPAGSPEPALRIDLQLDGVGEVREHFFRSEQIEFEALRNLDGLETLNGGEIICRTLLVLTGASAATSNVGFHNDRRRHGGIIRFD